MGVRSGFELGGVSIPLTGGGTVSAIVGEPQGHELGSHSAVVLGHGAGNDMHDPLLSRVHEALAGAGILAVKFNFPYREQDRQAPDRAPILVDCFRDAVRFVKQRYRPRNLVLGGKSLGGRIASHLAAEGGTCDGLVFLGYPLVSPGLEPTVRDVHLYGITVPMLFIGGTRDNLAPIDMLNEVVRNLGKRARLLAIADADHSFELPPRSPLSQDELLATVCGETVAFVREVERAVQTLR
ncbi:MAG: alpha/beta family hydrolase [Planctomycetota bacterium]